MFDSTFSIKKVEKVSFFSSYLIVLNQIIKII